MSNVQPSADSVPTLLGRSDPSPFDKSIASGLVGLVYLARQAFEERRRKQCLEMTAAILRIEPEHAEARTIRDAVRADLDRDFATARALAIDAQAKNDRVLYARAAAALRRIVDADSENLGAQSLLNETLAAGYFTSESRPKRLPRASLPAILIGCLVVGVPVVSFIIWGRTPPIASAQQPAITATTESTETILPDPPEVPNSTPVAQTDANAVAATNISSTPVPAIELRSDNRIVRPNATVTPAERTGAVRQAPIPPTLVLPSVPAAPVMGFLAVSAAVPVDIYRGNEFLGSTPTTLQLAAGSQILEYRYQGSRQTVTHAVAGQETTTATISFPIRVQINARPWAQVFLDGTRLTPLGQTPLGDVAVPIGSILVFQNPGYPEKRYRVTARDAAIQVTFP